jgi:hypothetical protein
MSNSRAVEVENNPDLHNKVQAYQYDRMERLNSMEGEKESHWVSKTKREGRSGYF